MNYLCVCQYGHSRSVALTRVLHHHNIPAVACGWQTAGEFLEWLCMKADRILLLEESFSQYIPLGYRDRCVVLDVGRDRWSNPYHPELLQLLTTMCENAGII